MFPVYLELGFDHILDLNGYDHILFLIALCAIFSIRDWKKIIVLVTAFTIGHSITLALSSLRMVSVPADLIELLIPVTILLTALQNLWYKSSPDKKWGLNYFLALFFGFIHGMGFSNFFKALLGQEAEIILPLLAFNLGVELGQLCIVACIIAVNYLVTGTFKLPQRIWTITVSIVAAALSVYLIIQKL